MHIIKSNCCPGNIIDVDRRQFEHLVGINLRLPHFILLKSEL